MYKRQLKPEARHRGIYEVVLYESDVQVQGRFGHIPFSELDIPRENIQFDKAHLVLGISDMRGIEKEIDLQWNGARKSFNPGVITEDVVSSGVNVPVVLTPDSSDNVFSFALDLKGSQYLHFVPVGKETEVNLKAPWANPSFSGAFLPDS